MNQNTAAFNTTLYFVRHAESVYVEGQERERGLTERGMLDAAKIADVLVQERIRWFYSSPYRRAVDTLRVLAGNCGCEITMEEDLRERKLSEKDLGKENFREAKQRVFLDPEFAFPGGESSVEAGKRAVAVLERILQQHAGEKVAIGTHGDIMTLMLNHYDPAYGYEFWENTSMPDIYKLEMDAERRLVGIKRLWVSS